MIFAALNSILSLAYYAPIVNAVYRQEPSEAVTRGQAMSWTMSVPLILLAVAIVILGVWPSLLAWMTGPAARTWSEHLADSATDEGHCTYCAVAVRCEVTTTFAFI